MVEQTTLSKIKYLMIIEGYNLDFSVKNLFDKNYENALDYSGTPRTMNVGLKIAY